MTLVQSTLTEVPQAPPRVRLFGVEIDAVRMHEAVAHVLAWIEQRDGDCHYVVTPNVDHVVMLQTDEALRVAYAEAGLVLADGAPLVAVSRLLGRGLPERVAGSDLVPALFQAAHDNDFPLRVFLLGGEPGVAGRAARNIHAAWPSVEVVATASPPRGFERDVWQNAELLEAIEASRPDLLLVGLGAPKQELWVYEHRQQIAAPVALCIGATIDFLAGHRRRAPRWMRRCGLEWFYRVAREPRRLARRYLRDALIFPRLIWRELVAAKQPPSEHGLRGRRD
ncbi:MAG TPA: WecB/TagA/CpsF family glycosyltransferase [Pirellulales bacterium]|nr:WecB/TagA/CpsF family glycosyltransferase [Pirellulales bacterium]